MREHQPPRLAIGPVPVDIGLGVDRQRVVGLRLGSGARWRRRVQKQGGDVVPRPGAEDLRIGEVVERQKAPDLGLEIGRHRQVLGILLLVRGLEPGASHLAGQRQLQLDQGVAEDLGAVALLFLDDPVEVPHPLLEGAGGARGKLVGEVGRRVGAQLEDEVGAEHLLFRDLELVRRSDLAGRVHVDVVQLQAEPGANGEAAGAVALGVGAGGHSVPRLELVEENTAAPLVDGVQLRERFIQTRRALGQERERDLDVAVALDLVGERRHVQLHAHLAGRDQLVEIAVDRLAQLFEDMRVLLEIELEIDERGLGRRARVGVGEVELVLAVQRLDRAVVEVLGPLIEQRDRGADLLQLLEVDLLAEKLRQLGLQPGVELVEVGLADLLADLVDLKLFREVAVEALQNFFEQRSVEDRHGLAGDLLEITERGRARQHVQRLAERRGKEPLAGRRFEELHVFEHSLHERPDLVVVVAQRGDLRGDVADLVEILGLLGQLP